MKTKWIILAAAVAFVCTGCSENLTSQIDSDPIYSESDILTEYFRVLPSGTTIHAFNGDVILDFPSGCVASPTRYSIVSFPLDHLDLKESNMMRRAFKITNVMNENEFKQPVTILMRYDLATFNMCQPGEESELAIHKFLGDRYYFHKTEASGECCMNCSCKTVSTCIEDCGTFVVVEN